MMMPLAVYPIPRTARLEKCFFFLIAVLSFAVEPLVGQQASGTTQGQPFVFSPADTIIYVSDFELDAGNFHADQGRTSIVQRPGIIGGARLGASDSETQATKLVHLMTTGIVNNLKQAGYKAQRLDAPGEHPSEGIWVHGVFTELDEGNRLRRAVVGFNSGAAEMQLYVTMSDLSRPAQPLYNMAVGGSSAKNMPGAVVTMNPYVAAAKFVVEKNAPEKTIKKTAGQISKEIIAHLQEHEVSPAAK